MPAHRTDPIVRVLEGSARPIYVLDFERNLVYCNEALARWTGVDSSELVGRRTDYHSQDGLTGAPGLAAGLCPPPKAFSGIEVSGHVSCMSRDGRVLHRRAKFVPLGAGEAADETSGVIALVDPVDLDAAELASDVERETADALHWAIQRFRTARAGECHLDRLIGTSPAIRRVRAQIELAAGSRASVLVVGPRGSGRSFVAQAIHYLGDPTRSARLVPVACNALAGETFRRAIASVVDRDDDRSVGTLWLQEVDRLASELKQPIVDLLDASSDRVRLVSTICCNPNGPDARPALSDRLWQVLATIVIELPPLAERQDDLPLLAQVFLEQVNREGKRQIGGISSEALDLLALYPWPSGLDELYDVIRSSHESAQGHEIEPDDLPLSVRQAADMAAHPRRVDETIVLDRFLAQIEVELIERALARAKGNKTSAARLLGMTRQRLYRRLIQRGLAEEEGGNDE